MYKVFIDAGHGGADGGAVGLYIEKDLNLDTSLRLKEKLELDGRFSIYTSRLVDSAVSLNERSSYANNVKSDIFISIHHNSSTSGRARGYEVYHSAFSVGGKRLSETICKEFDKYNKKHRGAVTKLNVGGRDYYHVLRKTEMPSVITEFEFVQGKINVENEVTALYDAILSYFKLPKKDTTQKIIHNAKEVKLETRLIDGFNYVKLRELEKLGFSVDYNADTNTVFLEN